MVTLLIVGGFLFAAGLLWLTPRVDPDRRSPQPELHPAPEAAEIHLLTPPQEPLAS
ncbi:MAG: hypothetical protein ACYDEN_03570 [Acidimicrobiales bacterium]